LSDQSPIRRIRARDCYEPRGPLSHSAFYRRVAAGDISLDHIGRRMAFVRFGSTDELIEDLIQKDRERHEIAK
jgi:hypothetical protein